MNFKPHFRFLIAVFILTTLSGYGLTPINNSDSPIAQKNLKQADSIKLICQQLFKMPLIWPKVTGVGSYAKGRLPNHAVYGDYIYLKIDSMPALLALTDSIAGKKQDTMSDIILYINGNAMKDIKTAFIDLQEKKLMFLLDRHSQDLMEFYPRFPTMWSTLKVSVSAGFQNGIMFQPYPSRVELNLEYLSKRSMIFSLLLLVCIVGSFVILATTTNLIRIGDDKSPFSLALTQLSFWSIVVASSFVYIWIVTDEIPPITGSTLILLSVSAFTTAGSKLLDVNAEKNHAFPKDHKSFIEDILQDNLGYSVHRAQMFMWTVILGIIFVTSVIRFQQIPQLDDSLLALMGISSGAYIGLKTMENKNETAPAAPEEKT